MMRMPPPPPPPLPYGGQQPPMPPPQQGGMGMGMGMGMPPPLPPTTPFPPMPNGMQPSGGPPMPMDPQGTNPRDMSSALINKDGQSPFVTDDKGDIPAWLKGFLQSPFAKWKSEGQAMPPAPTGTQAFQPPMQMGQTHQQPQDGMSMPPMWAMSHNAPTG